jgi:hypothetical protein
LKSAGWIAAALALALSVFLGHGWMDRAKAADDAYAEVDRQGSRAAMAMVVLNRDWIGRPAADLDALAQRMKADGALVKRVDDGVEIDEMSFHVKDGRVVRVDFFDPH